MTPGPQNLPQEWWGDPKTAWAMLDAARQDDDIKRLAGEVQIIKDKLDGKTVKDVNEAHARIRALSAEAESLKRKLLEKKLQNWALTAVVSFIAYILFQLAGAGFHHFIH